METRDWSKALPVVLVVVLVAIVAAGSGMKDWVSLLGPSNESPESIGEIVDKSDGIVEDENDVPIGSRRDALKVRLTDNQYCAIEMTLSAQIVPDRLIEMNEKYGGPEGVINRLRLQFEGNSISVLEQYDEKYLRANREEIEGIIVGRLASTAEDPGYKVDLVKITEIACGIE